MRRCTILLVLTLSLPASAETTGYVDSNGVKIHYQTAGSGPLVVLLHGFPDYHRTWRYQIPVLSKRFQVVAIDLRGYNLSDKPEAIEDYAASKLIADVAAVLTHFKAKKATLIGHDWGGMIAWQFAMTHPDKTERLVILNCPHPAGIARELANNPQQQKASEYARVLQQEDTHTKLKPEMLVFWVKDDQERKNYLEALKRSSMKGMLAYYKMNYPKPPYREVKDLPKVKCPTLVFHGLADPYLLPGALNDTWNWLDSEWTLITIPKAGHWVHHDAKETVNRHLTRWLTSE